MPTYKFTSNGKTIKVTGDTPPSESELDDIFKAAGVSTDVGSSTTVPEAPSVAQLASAKTPDERIAALKDTPVGGDLQKVLSLARLWATNGPHAVVQGIKDFMGGDYAKGAHEAISGAGITALPMVAGPAVMAAAGAPVTAAATLAGGYAGGKLAPMAAEALGATPDQAALAGDVGMVAGAGAGGRLLQMPARAIAKGALNATAAALDNPVAGVVSPRARNLGEMAGKLADAIKANPAAAEEAGVHLDLSKRVQAGSLTQQQIGERLAAAKAQGMNAPAYEPATNPAEPVRVPLPEKPKPPVVQPPTVRPQATGTSMQPAAMPTPRAAAPVPEGPPEPSMAKPAAEPFNPPREATPKQQNEARIAEIQTAYKTAQKAVREAADKAGIDIKAPDEVAVVRKVIAGATPEEAISTLAKEDPAAELARRLGTPSDAERRFPPNKSGLPSNPPTARKARGKVSDLADMKSTAPIETPTTVPKKYADWGGQKSVYDLSEPYHNEILHVTTPKGKAGIQSEGFKINKSEGFGTNTDDYGPGVYMSDYQSDMGGFWRHQLETKNFEGIVETASLKGNVSLERPFRYEYTRYNRNGDSIGRIDPRDSLKAQRPDLVDAYDKVRAKEGMTDRKALAETLRKSGFDGIVIAHRAGDEIVAFEPSSVKFDSPNGKLSGLSETK